MNGDFNLHAQSEARKTILATDDKQYNLTDLHMIMGNEYDIIATTDPMKCLQILRSGDRHIDLVISDMIMPSMSGIELLEKMNEEHLIDTIPVIIASSIKPRMLVEKALSLGCSDYIEKPYKESVLRKSIEKALDERQDNTK